MKGAALTVAEAERLRQTLEDVPFARLLGIKLLEAARGAVTLQMEARDDLKQNQGLLHGGATASLIDTSSAFAVMTLLAQGETATTVDLTIHYLVPLFEGRATAHARVLRAGRRLLVLSVEVFDQAESLAATAITTYLRLRRT